jgi:ribonuclease P protein component
MLPKENRIVAQNDFRYVMRKGRRGSTPTQGVTVHVVKRTDGVKRYGFIITKKTGNAVTRNRLKRQLREIAYKHMTETTTGCDVVMRVNPSPVETTWEALNTEVFKILNR